MESIVINPKTKDEAKIIADFLKKLNISSNIITEDEKEDLGLLMMMKETDSSDLVSREEVMKKLKS
jgi:hypothetical protein